MLKAILTIILLSDQCYNWSDNESKGSPHCTSETAKCSSASAAAAAFDPARFSYRAIQAMRQAGMQVRRRPWAWPQVLPVSKLPGRTAADGLRATGDRGTGGRVSGQLSSGARDPGPDLRDQPRVAAPPRGALKRMHGRIADSLPCTDRDGAGGCAVGQYAGRLARGKPRSVALFGGRP